jgi:hypothetical protein
MISFRNFLSNVTIRTLHSKLYAVIINGNYTYHLEILVQFSRLKYILDHALHKFVIG